MLLGRAAFRGVTGVPRAVGIAAGVIDRLASCIGGTCFLCKCSAAMLRQLLCVAIPVGHTGPELSKRLCVSAAAQRATSTDNIPANDPRPFAVAIIVTD